VEPLLTGGVPQLKDDRLVMNLKQLGLEAAPDGGLPAARERRRDVTLDDRRLAHVGGPQDDDLDHRVAGCSGGVAHHTDCSTVMGWPAGMGSAMPRCGDDGN